MAGKLKVLSLPIVIAMLVGVAMAPPAAATSPYSFNSDGDWTALSGEQTTAFGDELRLDGSAALGEGVVKCEKTTYTGSNGLTEASSIILEAVYDGCKLEPFGKATIDMNGCKYALHADNQTTNGKGELTGEFDTETAIECPEGKDVTITATVAGVPKCTVHVESQGLGTGIVLTNAEKEDVDDLTAHINFANVKYTQTTGEGAAHCDATSTTSNGVYKGTATIQGQSTAKSATNIRVGEPYESDPYTFNSDGDWTVLSGAQTAAFGNELRIDGNVVLGEFVIQCEKTTYTGSTGLTEASSITLEAVYDGCKLGSLGNATFHMNGCRYEFYADGQRTNEKGELTGAFDTESAIVCPPEKDITITVTAGGLTNCTVHVEPQGLGTGIVLTNAEKEGVDDLTAHINFASIKYTETKGEGALHCDATGTTSNGVYKSTATLKGFSTEGKSTNVNVG